MNLNCYIMSNLSEKDKLLKLLRYIIIILFVLGAFMFVLTHFGVLS